MNGIYILIAVLLIGILCCIIEYKRICFKEQNLLTHKLQVLQEVYEQKAQEISDKQTSIEKDYENHRKRISDEIAFREEQLKLATKESNAYLIKLEDEIKQNNEILNQQKKTISIINETINQKRQEQEQIDFYRVCISESQKQDMAVLMSMRSSLNDASLLNKFIYDSYIAKSAEAMLKRILHGDTITGIYKITRLKTGEIYIGQAVDIKKRWQGHIKTACGCGQLASSLLHTAMAQDGIDQFMFELVETTTRDKLTEREKFWIQFYDSKNFGLNMRVG